MKNTVGPKADTERSFIGGAAKGFILFELSGREIIFLKGLKRHLAQDKRVCYRHIGALSAGRCDGMGRIPERWREHLGTTDAAIITARRMLLRLARELQDGKEPYAPHHGDAYRVRPIDVVSDEGDFGKLYSEQAELAVATA